MVSGAGSTKRLTLLISKMPGRSGGSSHHGGTSASSGAVARSRSSSQHMARTSTSNGAVARSRSSSQHRASTGAVARSRGRPRHMTSASSKARPITPFNRSRAIQTSKPTEMAVRSRTPFKRSKAIKTSASARVPDIEGNSNSHFRSVSAPPVTQSRDNDLVPLPISLSRKQKSITESEKSSVQVCKTPIVLRPDEAPTPSETVVVYTDGSCRGNYASGAGVYFGKNHPLNCSQALPGPIHSSVMAELQAARIALERLRSWRDYGGERVIVRSDCKAIVDGFKRGYFSDTTYTEQLSRLRMAAQQFSRGVEFQHVYGHNGHPGNEEADRLAREAIQGSRGRSMSVDHTRRRSRSRSKSRDGRGAPDSTYTVRPE